MLEYTSRSADLDDILWRMDLVVCQSLGNTGMNTGRPEAWAKNSVAVGGINHNDTETRNDDWWQRAYGIPESADEDVPCFSSSYPACSTDVTCTENSTASFGPAPDGRIKPDLCHFFDRVDTTVFPHLMGSQQHSCYFRGTSAATPIVAGYFGLLFQMWHEGEFAGFGGGASVFASRPHMTTAKALLINSAYQYPFGSPNNMTRERQGWGIPDLKPLHDHRYNFFIVNETADLVGVGASASYQLSVDPSLPFKVTMVFADPAPMPLSSASRVADLHLLVTSPSGMNYYGNSGLSTGHWTTATGASDKKNTVESVFIQNPQSGTWTVRVEVFNLPQDCNPETPDTGPASWDVDFALVVSGVTASASHSPADWNADGSVDAGDFTAFIADFLAGRADLDGDGSTSSADFLAFVDAFVSW